MKFKTLEVSLYPTAKCGDTIEIGNKNYVVIGYTDAGSSLLVQSVADYEVYKLIKRPKKEKA